MRLRTLGRTGLKVSEIGHGLWGMGDWTDAEAQQSADALDLSAKLGCNFYDSAWAYGDGKSDHLLGEALSRNSSLNIIAATKVPPMNLEWPAKPEYRYQDVFPQAHVLEFAKRSLTALKRPNIDLLQFHVWDDSWANEAEFQETIEQLKAEKIIKHFGLSLNRWEPENGIEAIKTGLVDSVQVIYNIFDQAPEDALFPICAEHNVGVIARVPLDEGSLGGKLTLKTTFPSHDFRSRYFGPQNLPETVARVESLKERLPPGMSLAELAIRFILSCETVSTLIAGMRQAPHINSNIACSDKGPLPIELVESLRSHRWDRQPTNWSG